jgi:hypothetical protein
MLFVICQPPSRFFSVALTVAQAQITDCSAAQHTAAFFCSPLLYVRTIALCEWWVMSEHRVAISGEPSKVLRRYCRRHYGRRQKKRLGGKDTFFSLSVILSQLISTGKCIRMRLYFLTSSIRFCFLRTYNL